MIILLWRHLTSGHCYPYEGTDSFTSMPCPGFKPGTFGVAVSLIHDTSWSSVCALRLLASVMYIFLVKYSYYKNSLTNFWRYRCLLAPLSSITLGFSVLSKKYLLFFIILYHLLCSSSIVFIHKKFFNLNTSLPYQ